MRLNTCLRLRLITKQGISIVKAQDIFHGRSLVSLRLPLLRVRRSNGK